MNLRQRLLWKPDASQHALVLVTSIVLTLALGWVHSISGLVYEFHLFFSLPIFVVAWFLGYRPALLVVFLAVGLWFAADRILGAGQAAHSPLLFNSIVRLTIFVAGSWTLAQMRRVLERESLLAREDTLTRLANRRAFREQGRAALAQASRLEAPISCVFIDLDKFKQVNDEQGHDQGDVLLFRVAEVFRARLRAGDIVGRMGGDEFVLLMPGMEDQDALAYVEDLRLRLLAEMRKNSWPVTFSIGIVSYRRAPEDLEKLLMEADHLMYEAKAAGRDCILQQVPDFSGR